MTEYRPDYGILAGAEFSKIYAIWKSLTVPKTANYSLLILKDGSEIFFESNIYLAGKVNLPVNINLTMKFE